MTVRSLLLAAVLALVLAAVPVAAGQVSAPGTKVDPRIADGSAQRALSNARKAWKAQGARAYTYLLSVNCFCPPTTDVRIIVRRGYPAKSTPRKLIAQASVPRLFLTIQRAIDDKASRLVVSYGKRGVPRSIFIDSDARVADEEIGYLVRSFALLRR